MIITDADDLSLLVHRFELGFEYGYKFLYESASVVAMPSNSV